jgi:hypothetical protein
MKTIVAILLLPVATHAQKYIGVATGNWSGMNAVYLNPANLADNRYKFAIDVFAVNGGIDNNLGKIDINKGLSRFLRGGLDDVNDIFKFSDRKTFSLVAPQVEVRGPGLIATINRKHSIAISTRLRVFNQFNNFDQSLYRTISDSAYQESLNGDISLQAKNFNWTAHGWAEVAASYGGVVLQQGRSVLKIGATVRYLSGLGFISLKGNNLDANYSSGQDSFYANNTDLQYASNIFSASRSLNTDLGADNFLNRYKFSNGRGVGADIGVVYDYIEDTVADRYEMDGEAGLYNPTKNKYKLRLSASVTDIGALTYRQEQNFGINVRGNGYITGKGFSDNVRNVDDFKSYALQQGFTVDTFSSKTRLYMPATLVASADYHIKKEYYVNALFMGNLVNRSRFGNSFYNIIAITPRWETARYMVSVPIAYSALANNVRMGLGLRAFGFFLGSDDLLGLFTKRQYGFNAYAGAFVPLYRKAPKDKDGDHVSDRRDRCPDDMGTWERHGCPEQAGTKVGKADKDDDDDQPEKPAK